MPRYSLRTLLLIALIAGPLLAWGSGYVERLLREPHVIDLEARQIVVDGRHCVMIEGHHGDGTFFRAPVLADLGGGSYSMTTAFHGTWTSFDSNGQIHEVRKYVDGVLVERRKPSLGFFIRGSALPSVGTIPLPHAKP